MSPTIVFGPDGSFKLATGSPGGPVIIDYVAQSLIAHDRQRHAHRNRPQPSRIRAIRTAPTMLEKDTALESLTPGLTAMGHTVAMPSVEKAACTSSSA